MNWFDSSELSKLATQTLKNAQKTIDRVLDIDEAAAAADKQSATTTSVQQKRKLICPMSTCLFL